MSAPASARRNWRLSALLPIVAVSQFMLVLDISIVNVALPSMQSDIGLDDRGLQWVVNGYALAFGGFLLLGGRAADLFGHRRVFIGGLAFFTLASLACGLADQPGALIAARSLQGLAAGVLSPVTLAILTATFREAAARSHALAVWTAVGVGGGAVGGLLGGVLTELLSWRAIFFVNVPLGVLVASAAVAVIPRDRLRFRRDLDLLGALTVTGGLVALSWGFIASNDYGWRSWQVGGALAGGVALMTAFVGIEWRLARFPLVPLSVFRSRSLAVGNGLGFLSFFAVFATWFFLTLYLQRVRGYSAIETGLIFLPLTMAVIAASQVGFRLVGRMNAALLTALASAISVAGLAWLGQLAPDTKLVWVVVPAVVTMIGGGLIFAPITVAATARVPPEQSGLASGILNTTRQVGGALGLAVLATAATTETGRHVAEGQAAALTAGFGLAFTVGAAVFMFGGFLGLVALPRRLPTEPAAANEEAMPWTLRGGRG